MCEPPPPYILLQRCFYITIIKKERTLLIKSINHTEGVGSRVHLLAGVSNQSSLAANVFMGDVGKDLFDSVSGRTNLISPVLPRASPRPSRPRRRPSPPHPEVKEFPSCPHKYWKRPKYVPSLTVVSEHRGIGICQMCWECKGAVLQGRHCVRDVETSLSCDPLKSWRKCVLLARTRWRNSVLRRLANVQR